MDADKKCPRSGRQYDYDYCLGIFREPIKSEKIKRQPCSYCQRGVRETNDGANALARAMGRR